MVTYLIRGYGLDSLRMVYESGEMVGDFGELNCELKESLRFGSEIKKMGVKI